MLAFRAAARPFASLIAGLITSSGRPAALAMAVAALSLLGNPAQAQAAQANWWESITGSGTPDYTGRRSEDGDRERAARQAEPLDDLRPDAMPMRSDEMIAAIDAAIAKYQQIADSGGWPVVPPGRMMREGEDDDRVPLLRRRLQMSGDMRTRNDGYNSYTFDGELTDAVKRYQRRNGLRPTGRVERSTYPALNMSVDQRIAQLRMNLGRIRELMANPVEERYVLVNVPAFQLEAVQKYEVQQRHRVIVGRTERQSPSVKATIRALNFFPYWRVPDSVAHLDLIPRLLKEPDYLQNEKIRVLDAAGVKEIDPQTVNWTAPEAQKLKFRQDPGPQNALGLVRIDMPNEHTVYMHDTPMKPLFAQRSRAFSAGCVRVEGVFNLVDWLAHYEQGWGEPGRAQQIVEAGQAVDVTLTRPVPVYFVYITAWAERDGDVEFRPDIYGRDGAVDQVAEMDRDPSEPAPAVTLAP
ncbi:L,D-transpeptidase family protein [Hyphomicrobium sp. xq]|uniref:L,D-transpeptidase family protein n=1 Tax=Hyphomicrobium album TaxID=2665159 RepID=A0A6I3KRH6_9HYPH|nr:L,D-transpeptidase family protein [Hyphomicrobium album]MTD96046.1 L,D-transpeptidase family protein [Hyphomicrobium album]